MADYWQYRIESYRRIPGEHGLTPVKDDLADVWLGFRAKDDDHRCFGAFPSRADAEKAVAILKERDKQPEPAADDRRQGYHVSHRRNGTEDEIIIHAPGGRHMAYIQFWDEGWDGPGAGDKEAKADARRIVAALNAYQPANPAPNQAAALQDRSTKAYHARQDKDTGPFGYGHAIDIRAPGGRSMAFVALDPDDSREDRAGQGRRPADRRRPERLPARAAQRSPKEEGIRGTLRAQLDAKSLQSPSTGTEARDKLIRANFDAYSDLTWVKELEPKFRAYNLDAATMKGYREAWNRHTEARDWNWWVKHSKGVPDAKLREEIAECKAEIDAIRKESPGHKPGIRGTLRSQFDAPAKPKPATGRKPKPPDKKLSH